MAISAISGIASLCEEKESMDHFMDKSLLQFWLWSKLKQLLA